MRVFHRFGDYQHKQRNRMKFLIKELGRDRFRAEVRARAGEVRAEGGAALPFDPEAPPIEGRARLGAPRPPSRRLRSPRACGRRGARSRTHAAAPAGPARARRRLRALAPHQRARRRSRPATPRSRSPCRSATSPAAQLRVAAATWPRPTATVRVRTTADQDLVLRWVRASDVPALYRRLAAASLGLPDANTIADVTSCPGRGVVPPGRHPVARPRPAARRPPARAARPGGGGRGPADQDQRLPERLRPPPRRRPRVPGQRAPPGRARGAAVLRDGRRRRGRRRARASAASRPRFPARAHAGGGGAADRRLPRRRAPGETATAFFRRVELARVKAALADLERLTPEDAARPTSWTSAS